MVEIAVLRMGSPGRRRRTFLAAALAALMLGAMLALPSRSHAEECPPNVEADICLKLGAETDDEGVYTLYIPPGFIGSSQYAYPQLKGCTWDVRAVFGDGSPAWEGTFNTEAGIQQSHKYPAYGIYYGAVDATNGEKAGGEPCASIHIAISVKYPEPEPPGGEPPEEEPPPGETPTGGGGGSTGGSGEEGYGPGNELSEAVYWAPCGHGLLVHRVVCGRARRVARVARRRFRRGLGGPQHVLGFTCQYRPSAAHRIACRRESRRIHAP